MRPGGISLAIGVCALLAACSAQHDDFFCGTRVGGDPTIVVTCSRVDEVCVCATHSCAMPVDKTECPSELRYVEEPYARSDVDGECVDEADAPHAIDQTQDLLCKPPNDAGVADAVAPDAAMEDAL
jgi:hypothetical protein